MDSKPQELTQEQLRRIDELCAAMDRECASARANACEDGRTPLVVCREIWTKRAMEGQPLPDRWCTDDEERAIQSRERQYGSREWRIAHPWLIEIKRANGVPV